MSEPEMNASTKQQASDDRRSPRSRYLRGRPGSCRKAPALAVEMEITWVDGEAADALRVAQARALRKVLTAIAAQRARTTDPSDVPEGSQ